MSRNTLYSVAIDFGTTSMKVGVWKNNTFEMILNEHNNSATPAVVAFTPSGRLFGEDAVKQMETNPKNTIYGIKKLIGRKFNHQDIQNFENQFPFKIIIENNYPLIEVDFKNETKRFRVEQIVAMLLSKMKQLAEQYLGHPVTSTVLSCPSSFNDLQRKLLVDSGKIAGLNVLRVIDETTAASIAYGFEKKFNEATNILVYNLGANYCDVSLVECDEGISEVKSTAGNINVGGNYFDDKMVQFFVGVINAKYGINISQDERAMRRLRTACETAKITLSKEMECRIEIQKLINGIDINEIIARSSFETIIYDELKNITEPIEKVLRNSRMNKSNISEVVFIGESTKIPKIRQILQQYFSDNKNIKINQFYNSVLFGLVLQSAILSGVGYKATEEVMLLDIAPFSLGIQKSNGSVDILIPKYSSIPALKSQIISTLEDNQTEIEFKIIEIEDISVRNDNILGQLELTGISAAPKGVPQIEVRFDIDANGILKVSAEDKSSGKKSCVTITRENERIKEERIQQMILEEKQYQEDDNNDDNQSSKHQLEEMIYIFKERFSKLKTDGDDIFNEMLQWLSEHQYESSETYQEKKQEIQRKLFMIFQKLFEQ